MKGFLEEYGLIIVVVSVILIMLALGTGVGEAITTNINNTIKQLFDLGSAGPSGFIAPSIF